MRWRKCARACAVGERGTAEGGRSVIPSPRRRLAGPKQYHRPRRTPTPLTTAEQGTASRPASFLTSRITRKHPSIPPSMRNKQVPRGTSTYLCPPTHSPFAPHPLYITQSPPTAGAKPTVASASKASSVLLEDRVGFGCQARLGGFSGARGGVWLVAGGWVGGGRLLDCQGGWVVPRAGSTWCRRGRAAKGGRRL